MYQCSKCNHTMSYPPYRCPSCGVLLSGVKCQGCGYVGGKQEFISNNHRCPKCGSVVEIPGGSGGASGDCFVATAVYGDPLCAEVQALRLFRDRRLVNSQFGRWFIGFYYKHGPEWAEAIRGRQLVQKCIRWVLNAIVSLLATRTAPNKTNAGDA